MLRSNVRRLQTLPRDEQVAAMRSALRDGPVADVASLDLDPILEDATWRLLDVLGDDRE